jgi:hypothetical protein
LVRLIFNAGTGRDFLRYQHGSDTLIRRFIAVDFDIVIDQRGGHVDQIVGRYPNFSIPMGIFALAKLTLMKTKIQIYGFSHSHAIGFFI